MDALLSLVFILAIANRSSAQVDHDPVLAARLGGDAMGMKQYSLVLLTTGPRTDLQEQERDSLFKGHMANIRRLADEGILSLAGPFGKNDRYRGLFILNTADREETEALLLSDPAIAGGALGYEIYSWYGSAAVQEVPAIHEKIMKE